jgi:hypothetical protein
MYNEANVVGVSHDLLLNRLIEIRKLKKSIDIEDEIVTKELLKHEGLHRKVHGEKYVQQMSKYSYKFDKESATLEDIKELYPECIKESIDAHKLFELKPDLVKRSLSRYFTLENYDPMRHVNTQ